MKYPKVFGIAKEQDWRLENIKIKLVEDYDVDTCKPFYITSVGPCRIWWEWRRVNKSTSKVKIVLDF